MKFAHAGSRISGIVVPLSALRSHQSPACGEYPDLAILGNLAADWNFELVQLLPVNDSGYQSSPYSALSAFALHPIYLRVAELPEVACKEGIALVRAAAELAALHADDERFRYGPYLHAKLAILERVFRELAAPRLGLVLRSDTAQVSTESVPIQLAKTGPDAETFARWISAHPWVKAYAVFSELKRRNGGKPWWEWEAERDPSPQRIEELWLSPDLLAGTRFRAWLQWRAEEQFVHAARALHASGIDLMGDIPILINEDSAEVWARRSLFRLGLSAGAPPDMYAQLGQNWGFPIYDWDALAREGYGFWRERLAAASTFYTAYRIDHVLGFFRIWALSVCERTGYLGRFVPDAYITRDELAARGFSPERIRWLSEPHLRTEGLIRASGGDQTAAFESALCVLDRIGDEELFLFKRTIRGERDIETLAEVGQPGYGGAGFPASLRDFLLASWRDRVLFEFEPERYAAAWRYREASAWSSLSTGEQEALEELFRSKRAEGERLWDEAGRKILGMLCASSDMLPCAEDLGSVPPCVPQALADLGILGLRVLRWTREWGKPGDPYVPLASYPELSVACPSVHDSSTLREWWEREADRDAVWALVGGEGSAPPRLEPEVAACILGALARSASRIVAFPLQDLLALGRAFRSADPAAERINVPGSVNEWNWGWRLPATLEAIAADRTLAEATRGLAGLRRLRA